MFNERYIALNALYERRKWYWNLGFRPAIEEEYEKGGEQSLVLMYMDLYNHELIESFEKNP